LRRNPPGRSMRRNLMNCSGTSRWIARGDVAYSVIDSIKDVKQEIRRVPFDKGSRGSG
jgi:hypothetical protein